MPTLANIRARVQIRINDTDSRKGTFGVVETDHAIADACLALQSQLPAPHVYLPSAFTILANTDTFRLPIAAQTDYVSATQYAGDVRIRLTNRNIFMAKRTVEELDALRQWDGATAAATRSWPTDFCLWEETDNDLQGRSWPKSAQDELCDLFVSLVPDDLRDAANLDAANVRFDRYGATALVYHAAALLAAQMTPEALKLRDLNLNVAALWLRQAQVLLYQSELRVHNNQDTGRIQRWVS